MSGQNNDNIYKIEDVANATLKGDMQRNVLDFVDYLRANDVMLDDSKNYFWNAVYKDKGLCVINISVSDEYGMCFDTFINNLPIAWKNSSDSAKIDERTKEIILANLRPHDPTCHGKCSPGSNKVIFGKIFDNLCSSFLGIYNPDTETVDCMKKIIGGLKADIDNNT